MPNYFQRIIRLLFVSTILACSCITANDNTYISIKYFGLSFHPHGAANKALIPLRIDKDGLFVPNLGIISSYEYMPFKMVGIKFSQAIYLDCALQPAAFTHLGLRGYFINKKNHQFNGGIGPTIIIRRSWKRLSGYIPYTFYVNSGNVDYKFLWYGGEFEYNYKFTNKYWFSVSFIPGYPDLMNLNFGLRW